MAGDPEITPTLGWTSGGVGARLSLCLQKPSPPKPLPWSTKNGGVTWFLFEGELGFTQRRRPWHPTPGLLPGKFHGRRSLVGCSPWGRYKSDMHCHFSLSCIGGGNGNPLQCSCLENPRDGAACLGGSHRVGHDWSDLAAAAADFTQSGKIKGDKK